MELPLPDRARIAAQAVLFVGTPIDVVEDGPGEPTSRDAPQFGNRMCRRESSPFPVQGRQREIQEREGFARPHRDAPVTQANGHPWAGVGQRK
ncbi:hypothetical protein GCM10009805_25820 [Leucobacter chromiireducens subsp. solipictus]